MHKNFRNSNKKRSIIAGILEKADLRTQSVSDVNNELNLPIIDRKNIQELIEKRVKIVGKMLPLQENKIRLRLLKFVSKNRVAMRYEQACQRYIKQFTPMAFLLCERCDTEHTDILWQQCKNCGFLNNYRI